MGVVIEQRYEVEKLVCQEEGQDGVGVEEDLDLCFDLHGLVYLCAEDAFEQVEWSGAVAGLQLWIDLTVLGALFAVWRFNNSSSSGSDNNDGYNSSSG